MSRRYTLSPLDERITSMRKDITDITINTVEVADANTLLKIYEPYVRDTAITFEYDVPTVEEFQNRISEISAKYPYIKAIDDKGTIVGYAYANTFKGRAAYDWSVETTIYVNRELQGKGIGKSLYIELEKRLAGMGILNANACIAVLRDDQTLDEHLTNGSVAFHEKLGYRLVGRFHDSGFKFNTWYDMVWMEKMLGEHTTTPQKVKFGTSTAGQDHCHQ